MTYLQQLGLAQVHRPDYARRNQDGVWTATFPTSLPDEAYFDSWITRNAKTLIEWSDLTPSADTHSLSLASYLSGETFEPTTMPADQVRRLQHERPELLFDLRLNEWEDTSAQHPEILPRLQQARDDHLAVH